jgi:hypothetical protein
MICHLFSLGTGTPAPSHNKPGRLYHAHTNSIFHPEPNLAVC